jgi:Zn-finger protein
VTRDDFTGETLTYCNECGLRKWIHDDDGGSCEDCIEGLITEDENDDDEG